MPRLRKRSAYHWVWSLLLFATLGACSGRNAGTSNSDSGAPDGAIDASQGNDAGQGHDAAPPPDADVPTDAGTDPCHCSGDEVWRWHECVPTLELGCGPTCEPGVTDCGADHTCEPCAASSACDTEDCRPTCVFTGPAMGPVADPLRLEPVMGTAGQSHTITISGFPFYVGALWYAVRLGDEDITHLITSGSTCSFQVDLPARPPDMVPLWVSAYGGTDPWVLAGFFTYSGGVTNNCIQPGFPCSPADSCCTTVDVAVTCQNARCLRQ